MKKRLQGMIAGMLIGATITGSTVFAINTTTLYNVIANGIKIVVDGQKLNPTDVNGNKVEPIIYNGTTYLPVRAVANALNKEVYWDGPNYTVYLGDMNGTLEYPTVELRYMDNIGDNFWEADSDELVDNYGNSYSNAIKKASTFESTKTFQTLLNMKYSRFKCTLYVPKGASNEDVTKIAIKADGKTIYTSPEILKTSSPIHVDLNVSGCNDFQIEVMGAGRFIGFIGDAGFYQ